MVQCIFKGDWGNEQDDSKELASDNIIINVYVKQNHSKIWKQECIET